MKDQPQHHRALQQQASHFSAGLKGVSRHSLIYCGTVQEVRSEFECGDKNEDMLQLSDFVRFTREAVVVLQTAHAMGASFECQWQAVLTISIAT